MPDTLRSILLFIAGAVLAVASLTPFVVVLDFLIVTASPIGFVDDRLVARW